MKLALGTVDFATRTGKHAMSVSREEAAQILALARAGGIDLLDTDPRAGNSQQVLAGVLPRPNPFRLMARGSVFEGLITNLQADQLEHSLCQSLQNLAADSLDTFVVASDEGLLEEGGDRLYRRLERLKEQNLLSKIGVSVQHGGDLNQVIRRYRPDVIQLPLNVLDQRLLRSGHLALLKEKGIEVHARSVFLQGVLLDPTHLHPWFWPARKLLEHYHEFLIAHGLTPLEGALSFAAGVPEVDYVLVGSGTEAQLREILDAMAMLDPSLDFSPFACPDEKITDPRRWNLYE